jgi:hypothetical protein
LTDPRPLCERARFGCRRISGFSISRRSC